MKIEMKDFWECLKSTGWEGYIWRVSDNVGPAIVSQDDSTSEPPDLETYNRIQEANLYHEASNTGLHVKLIDGKELVYKYELSQYQEGNGYKLSDEEIVPGSKKDLEYLKFRNLYQLTSSPLSAEGTTSWIQVAQIFTGFNKQKDGSAKK
jgi:CRISPR type III-associated protein (TIGR04423 family)